MIRSQTHHSGSFDTLQYAKQLEQAGFTRQQAEIQAETFYAIVQNQLVSKRDIEKVRGEIAETKKELTLEIAQVKKELTLEIATVRKDLTVEIEKVRQEMKIGNELLRRDLKIWMGGILVLAVGTLSTVVSLLWKLSH